MARVSPSRRTGRIGVSRVTTLFENHHHIVQPVDGVNDFGVDLYVSFVEELNTTADTIALQVRSGVSNRSARGYRVRIGNHHRDWSNPNVPVVCVVHDPETDTLHWANATEQLRSGGQSSGKLRSIEVPKGAVLDDETLAAFAGEMRRYLSRGMHVVRALEDIVGWELEPMAYLSQFINAYGDLLVFQQPLGDKYAYVHHSRPEAVPLVIDTRDAPEKIDFERAAWIDGGLFVGDFLDNHDKPEHVVLTVEERMWIRLCVHASAWWRDAPALRKPDALDEQGLPEVAT